MARSVLNKMVETGDYFFFALTADNRVTTFRSAIKPDNLAGLKADMHASRLGHQRCPVPPGGLPVQQTPGATWTFAHLGLSG